MKTENEDPEEKKSRISETLVEALTAYYEPAETFEAADDTKTTQELISEMSDIEDISPYEVNRLMEEHQFKIHYNGSSYVWLLKLK
jgi:hypothetical protein